MSGWHFFLEITSRRTTCTLKIALIAIFFSGGDWRLFGGKRTSLDG